MSSIQVERKTILPHKEAHAASINCIQYLPDDSKLLATGSSDDTIRIWDEMGKEIKIFIGHVAPITQLDFGIFDNKLILASSSEDGTVKIWDYETAQIIQNFIEAANIVKVVKIKNNKVLTGSKDKHLRIYDLKSQKLVFDFEFGGITAIAVHPFEHYFAVGTTSNHLIIVDMNKGEIIKKIIAHELPIQGLDFSSDGKLLVSAALNKQVKVWNTQNNFAELIGFQAHTSPVTTVKFRPQKDSFATGGFDRYTHLFQPGSMKPLKRYKGPKLAVTDICWNNSGDRIAIASADGSFRIFDYTNENEAILILDVCKQYITKIILEKSKNNLIAGYKDGSIKFFSLEKYLDGELTEKQIIPEAHKGMINCLRITNEDNLLSASEEKFIKVWDTENLSLKSSTSNEESHTLGVNDVFIHPVENWCLTVSADTFIKKWSLPDLQLLETYTTHKYAVNSITVSSDFEYIVTCSNDKRVVLHDKNMKELFTYKGHTDSVLASSFASGNRFLFTGAKNGKIIIFDILKEKEVNIITLHSDEILKFLFSDDHKFLAIISNDNHCSIFSYEVKDESSFELKNIFMGLFAGNPTDVLWISQENGSYSLLVSTIIGELIELSFKTL